MHPYIYLLCFIYLFLQYLYTVLHRITDHLLAMARPSTEIIEKFNIIEQFHAYVKLNETNDSQ